MWEFFSDRLVFESWKGGGSIAVEVEPVEHDEAAETVEPIRPAAVDR
jgi:hypothetical protein